MFGWTTIPGPRRTAPTGRTLPDLRIYRNYNVALECLAAGDHAGAVDAARELCSRLAGDPNARMRLGLTLVAGGDPEGDEILGATAQQSDKWLAYVRQI